jgi:rod shape-determining protein MreB
MVIDIGGGTTDIGVVSMGGMVSARNVRIAGDRFNSDIISYIRNEFKILVGEKSAEDIKILVGSVIEARDAVHGSVRGRDLVSGLPREVAVTDTDVRNAIAHSIDELIDSIKEVLETTPPEVLADVMQRGIYLAGGGALIKGLPELLTETTGVLIKVAPDPLTAVVRGTAAILDNFELYRDALLMTDDELIPTH